MVIIPLPPPGDGSSLNDRVPPTSIATTPGGMSLNLSPCPSQASRRWESNFLLLLQFRDREGHLRVPARHVEDGHKLGRWISKQRYHKRLGTLCPERLRRLNEIGIVWNAHAAKPVPLPTILTTPGGMSLNLSSPCPSQASRSWESNFLLLLQFRDREEHLRVPRQHVEDGKRLGAWIDKQRVEKKKGTLCPERLRRLKDIGFFRTRLGRPAHDIRLWDSNFQLLLQFKQREGHLRVPVLHVEDGHKLGNWIRKHRTQQIAGTLAIEKERRLNEIGFIWKGHDEKWDIMCRALAQFKEREGHCDVPNKHIEILKGAVLNIGAWLKNQCLYQSRAELDAQRMKRLDRMGVQWNSNRQEISQEFFDRNFDLLLAFQDREGHVRVPTKHQEGGGNNRLGAWLAIQRSLRRRGLLELDRRKWLEVAGVEWGEWESRGTQEENEGEEEKRQMLTSGSILSCMLLPK
jgi:ribosomal protein L7Ae-like RNA K-turn-binding protein